MRKQQRKILLSVCSALAALTMLSGAGIMSQSVKAAETAPTFEMIYGAGIRVSDPTGIRFKTKMSEEYYNDLKNGTDGAQLHFALLPYAMYKAYQADSAKGNTALYPWLVSKYTANGIVDVAISAEKLYTKTENGETYYCANGVLSNVYFNNYHLNFVGVAYIQRGTAGNYSYQDVTGITDEENARSVFEVACKASENEEDYTKYKTFLDTTVEKGMYRAYGVSCQQTIDSEGNKTTESYTYGGETYASYEAMKEGLNISIAQSTVTIAGGETFTIEGGMQQQFDATLAFSDGTEYNKEAYYTWSSSDETIVAIDDNGVATAKGLGEATITVSAIGGRFTDTCTVNVTKGGTVNLDYEFLAQGDAGILVTDTGNATIDLTEMGIVGTNVTGVLCNGESVTVANKSAKTITLTNAPAGKQEYTFQTTVADYVLDGCVYNQGISTKEEFLAWQTAAAAGTGKGYTVLLDDIDLEGATLTAPTTYYYGTFDGRAYTVSDFTYTNGVIWMMYPSVFKNVQFTEAVQDCSFANADARVAAGFFGANLRGTVENVKISTTIENIPEGYTHRGVFAYTVNWFNGEDAPTMARNVIVEVTPQAGFGHFAMHIIGGNYASIENLYMYLTNDSGTGSLYMTNNGTVATSAFYNNKETMVSNVDFSTWGEPWQIGADGVPYIGKAVERETIEIAGEFLAKGDAGATVTNTGNATFDLSATGYDFSGATHALCNGETIALAGKTATSVTVIDAPAGKQVYTIVTPTANYVINGFVYNQGISTKDEFLAWQASAATAGTDKGYTVLLDDIDLEGATLTAPTTSPSPIYYLGTFDGRGYTVSDFTYTNGVILMMHPSVVKNVQFMDAVQDCTFAGTAVVQYGFFGNNLRGTVENVKISVTTENIASTEHRGVLTFGLNTYGTTTAPSLIQNVVVEVTPQNGIAHYALQGQSKEDGLATINNVFMYFTASGTTGGFGKYNDTVHTNSGFYASESAMLGEVDFSTWGEPWQVDKNGSPYIGKEKEIVTISVSGVLNAPAGGRVDSEKTGIATVDFTSTGYTLGEVYSVKCGTLDIGYTVNDNVLTLTDAPAGAKVYTIITDTAKYIVTLNVYIAEKEQVIVESTFYGTDNDKKTLAIESAPVDFGGSEVVLGNVQAVTYGDGTAVAFAANGNTLTLTNAPAGEETYTIITDTKVYTVNICLYGYGISNAEEFLAWQASAATAGTDKAYTVLLDDIDLEKATLTAPTTYYYGTFDGRAHTVSDFTYTKGVIQLQSTGLVKNVQFTDAVQDCADFGSSTITVGFFGGNILGTVENVKICTTTKNITAGVTHRSVLSWLINGWSAEAIGEVRNVVIEITPQEGITHYIAQQIGTPSKVENVHAYFATTGITDSTYPTGTKTNFGFHTTKATMVSNVDFSMWGEPWAIGADGVPYIGEPIVRERIKVAQEFLAQGDAGTATASTGNATVDFSDTEVTLGMVQSVTYGEENTAATYTANGNALTLVNAPAGTQTYTIVTSGNTYIVDICVYGHGISTKDEFLAWQSTGAKNANNKCYTVLLDDIDLEGATLYGLGAYDYYYGTFDGRAHTVSDFTYSSGVIKPRGTGVVKNTQFIDAVQDCAFQGDAVIQAGFFGAGLYGTVENIKLCVTTTNITGVRDHRGVLSFTVGNGSTLNGYAKNVIIEVTPQEGNHHYVTQTLYAGSTLENVYMYFKTSGSGAFCATNKGTATNSAFYDSAATMLENVDFSTWEEPWVIGADGIPYIGKAVIGTTSYSLVKNGATEYSYIMAGEGYGPHVTAATVLQSVFTEATGATLGRTTEAAANYNENAKYISLGNTTALQQAGIQVDYDMLGSQGYQIITQGQSIFICGEEYGVLYGVYELLNRLFGYEVYTTTRYAINTMSDVALPAFSLTDIPDIEYRLAVNGELAQYTTSVNATRRALRLHNMGDVVVDGGNAHNMTTSIVPYNSAKTNWFYNGGDQLCYTAHGNSADYNAMVAEAVANIKALLLADTDANLLSLTQMDMKSWCNCSACTALKSKYGTDAASQIIFVNDVTDIVNDWLLNEQDGREVQFAIFAYYTTKTAPATQNPDGSWTAIDETVVLNDNVSVWIAPIEDDFRININNTNNSNNMRTMIESWSACTSSYFIWAYDTYFNNYMIPYDTYDAMQDMIRFCAEYNTKFFYPQGAYDLTQNTSFGDLKAYLYAKLMWNCNLDVNTLIDNFFKDVYKEAAASMKLVFEAWRDKSATFGGNIYSSSDSWLEIYRTFDTNWLKTQLGLLETAISEIAVYKTSDEALYTAIYDSIVAESISLRYLYERRNGTDYSSAVWGKLADDAARLGVNKVSEGEDFKY